MFFAERDLSRMAVVSGTKASEVFEGVFPSQRLRIDVIDLDFMPPSADRAFALTSLINRLTNANVPFSIFSLAMGTARSNRAD